MEKDVLHFAFKHTKLLHNHRPFFFFSSVMVKPGVILTLCVLRLGKSFQILFNYAGFDLAISDGIL